LQGIDGKKRTAGIRSRPGLDKSVPGDPERRPDELEGERTSGLRERNFYRLRVARALKLNKKKKRAKKKGGGKEAV